MKILTFSFETELRFSQPVTQHDFILRCIPLTSPTQTVLDAQCIVTPATTITRETDGFGNLLQVGRIEERHRSFTFISSGTVVVEVEESVDEPLHPMYLQPSQMTQAGPAIRDFASDVLRVCANLPPFDKAIRLSHALAGTMTYERGVTDVNTTAEEALVGRRGVCQDYAHVLIALCRQAGVAARYVNGFLFGRGETHAWVEVYDGCHWRGVDPANDTLVDDGYVKVAQGRDFADCPIERGVFRGDAKQRQTVNVQVIDDAAWAALGAYGERGIR